MGGGGGSGGHSYEGGVREQEHRELGYVEEDEESQEEQSESDESEELEGPHVPVSG